MRLLRPRTLRVPHLLTIRQYSGGSIKYILDRMEPVTGKVTPHIATIGVRVVVALEVKYPEGVQVRVHGHV